MGRRGGARDQRRLFAFGINRMPLPILSVALALGTPPPFPLPLDGVTALPIWDPEKGPNTGRNAPSSSGPSAGQGSGSSSGPSADPSIQPSTSPRIQPRAQPGSQRGSGQSRKTKPRPIDQSDWIPSEVIAARCRQERCFAGFVGYTLLVDETGRATDCAVTRTSGSREIDVETCNRLLRGARFAPATNSAGEPIRGRYASAVTWTVSQREPAEKGTEATGN